MKANEAPEKLYISPTSFEVGENFYSILTTKSEGDIEYVRKDAFIEKACEWLEPVLKNYAGYYVGKDILEDFKNYMKGE